MIPLIISLSWIIYFYIFFYNYKIQKNYIFFNVTYIVFLFFLIYYSLPVLFNTYFSNNYSYDYRLYNLNITANENFYISLHIFIGSLGFLFSFLFSKRKIETTKLHFRNRDLIIILLLMIIILNLLNFIFLDFDTSYFSSRSDAYLFARELSFGVRLGLKIINVSIFYLELIFLFKLFQYFSTNKKIIWFFILIFLLKLYLTINIYTQRSEIFIQLAIIIISYNLFVNRISFKVMASISCILIFILISWGAVREGGEFLSIVAINNLGEFDMIYANFIDIYRNKPELINFSRKFYDLYAFIPSFFLWFEKSSLPIWFLQNYHPQYYSVGGGYGFGILSESVYGYGLLETFFKTFFLSLVLNYLFRKYLTSSSFYYEIYYIILFISAPMSIRVTSFSFATEVIQFGIMISLSVFIIQKLMNIKLKKNSKVNVK